MYVRGDLWEGGEKRAGIFIHTPVSFADGSEIAD
jgi:hypothetical protein